MGAPAGNTCFRAIWRCPGGSGTPASWTCRCRSSDKCKNALSAILADGVAVHETELHIVPGGAGHNGENLPKSGRTVEDFALFVRADGGGVDIIPLAPFSGAAIHKRNYERQTPWCRIRTAPRPRNQEAHYEQKLAGRAVIGFKAATHTYIRAAPTA